MKKLKKIKKNINNNLINNIVELKKENKLLKEENSNLWNGLNIPEEIMFKVIEYDFLDKIDLKKEVVKNNQTFDKENLRQLKIGLRLNRNIEKLRFNENKLKENTELDEILSSIQNCHKITSIFFNKEDLGSNPENIKKILNVFKELENLQMIG